MRNPNSTEGWRLSPRQEEVRQLLEQGLYYKEIAPRLGISVNTVKKHCGKLFRKVGADSARLALYRYREATAPT